MITNTRAISPITTAIVALVSVEICMIVATNITATIAAAAYFVLYPIASKIPPTNSANAAKIPQNNGAKWIPRYPIADPYQISVSDPPVNLDNPNISATANPNTILIILIAVSCVDKPPKKCLHNEEGEHDFDMIMILMK